MEAPVQTPASFLEGGGTDLFSAHCVEQLLKEGYDPEWFGSHDHVSGKIQAAKRRVAAHKAFAEGKRSEPGEPLQPGDEYLAKCQAGHISQDATHRKSGGRDDTCANLQFGYDTSTAPCMPQMGGAWNPPGGEHNVASRHEVACALRDRQKADGTISKNSNVAYDPEKREADEKERLKLLLDKDRKPPERESLAAKPSSSSDKAIGSGPGSDSAAGASAKDPAKPSIPEDEKIKGDDAADCINNFKNAAMVAMRSKVMQDRINNEADNRTLANGGAQKPGESAGEHAKRGEEYRKQLKGKAKETEDQLKDARKDRKGLQGQANAATMNAINARRATDADPDNPALQQRAREHGEWAQRAKDDLERAKERERWLKYEHDRASGESDKAHGAHCDASEGAMAAKLTPEAFAAACQNPGMNRPDNIPPTARVSGLHDKALAGFNRTEANDPRGPINP
jgi:hypothetical protein